MFEAFSEFQRGTLF